MVIWIDWLRNWAPEALHGLVCVDCLFIFYFLNSRSKKQLGSSVTEEEKKKREDTNTSSELDDGNEHINFVSTVDNYVFVQNP